MIVKELIKELSKMDKKSTVIFKHKDKHFNECEIEKKLFIDEGYYYHVIDATNTDKDKILKNCVEITIK